MAFKKTGDAQMTGKPFVTKPEKTDNSSAVATPEKPSDAANKMVGPAKK